MRLEDLTRWGIKYVIVGCVVAIFAIIVFFIAYKIIYQRCMHGTKKIGKWKTVWFILFVIYGVILLGATFLSRGRFYSDMQIVPPLASYREAWYQGRMSNVRNIAVNIILFIPFGFLLPIGIKRMKPFWKTYMAGFATTVVIELLQLVTNLGIFECDDIINNLVGTMIGYGFFTLFNLLVCKENKKEKLLGTLVCQLPLLICIMVIAVVCLAYQKQELGNLSIHYVTKIPESKFEIVSNCVFDSQEERAFVYRVEEYTLSETRELANQILCKSGSEINDAETDIYDENVYYRGTGRNIAIDYLGGVYDYTNFDSTFSEGRLTEKTDGTEEEVLEALHDLGVEAPEGAIFENQGEGVYTFTANLIKKDNKIYDGQLRCTLMNDGSIAGISNKIYACTTYKEFEIITEKEAFKRVQDGEFLLYFGEKDKAIINVQDVSLGYLLDSKSFYQPVYLFDVTIDDNKYQIPIPAIK